MSADEDMAAEQAELDQMAELNAANAAPELDLDNFLEEEGGAMEGGSAGDDDDFDSDDMAARAQNVVNADNAAPRGDTDGAEVGSPADTSAETGPDAGAETDPAPAPADKQPGDAAPNNTDNQLKAEAGASNNAQPTSGAPPRSASPPGDAASAGQTPHGEAAPAGPSATNNDLAKTHYAAQGVDPGQRMQRKDPKLEAAKKLEHTKRVRMDALDGQRIRARAKRQGLIGDSQLTFDSTTEFFASTYGSADEFDAQLVSDTTNAVYKIALEEGLNPNPSPRVPFSTVKEPLLQVDQLVEPSKLVSDAVADDETEVDKTESENAVTESESESEADTEVAHHEDEPEFLLSAALDGDDADDDTDDDDVDDEDELTSSDADSAADDTSLISSIDTTTDQVDQELTDVSFKLDIDTKDKVMDIFDFIAYWTGLSDTHKEIAAQQMHLVNRSAVDEIEKSKDAQLDHAYNLLATMAGQYKQEIAEKTSEVEHKDEEIGVLKNQITELTTRLSAAEEELVSLRNQLDFTQTAPVTEQVTTPDTTAAPAAETNESDGANG